MIRWINENLGGSRAPEMEELEQWKNENVDIVINLLEGSYGRFFYRNVKFFG